MQAGLAMSYNFVSGVELPGALQLYEARLRGTDAQSEAADHIEARVA